MPRAELEPLGPVGVHAGVIPAGEAQSASPETSAEKRPGRAWPFAFLAVQFGCQIALLFSSLAPLRIVFRSLSIGTSLLFLLLIPGWGRRVRPAEVWALAVIAAVTLSALNPGGGSLLAVLVHWAFYVAVLAPLFWVGRLEVNTRTLAGLLICLWAFHTASSVVGLLQVAFPGHFQPAITTFIDAKQTLNIRLASGEWVPRPMGLTDTPGAAGPSGFYATLCGLGIVLTRPFPFSRLAGLLSMLAGMSCIYLSQVRVSLVLLGVCFAVLIVLLTFSGHVSGVVGLALLGGAVTLASFEFAFAMGGEMMINRLTSLTEKAPLTVYQLNRGSMLEYTIMTLVPKYPLGAGLGHWGMMNAYFGSRADEIGAELQWSGWVLDGGVPLAILYAGALLTVLVAAVRESLSALDSVRRSWVAIVAAYNVGTLALCFSYTPFMSTAGLEFWLLNAIVLHTTVAAPAVALRRASQIRS